MPMSRKPPLRILEWQLQQLSFQFIRTFIFGIVQVWYWKIQSFGLFNHISILTMLTDLSITFYNQIFNTMQQCRGNHAWTGGKVYTLSPRNRQRFAPEGNF